MSTSKIILSIALVVVVAAGLSLTAATAEAALASGNGVSSLKDSKEAGVEAATKAKAALGKTKPKLVLVYDAAKDKQAVLAGVATVFDASIIYGCPGYGPITQDSNSGDVAVLAMGGDITVTTAMAKVESKRGQKACGEAIGKQLKAATEEKGHGKLLLLFGDCHVNSNNDLVKGACSVIGEKFPVIGGAAKGSGASIYFQGKVVPKSNVGILISGHFTCGFAGRKDMSKEGLVSSATKTFTDAAGKNKVALMLVFDCGGRRGALDKHKIRGDELAAMKAVAGKTPIFGFYGSGETGPMKTGEAAVGVGYHLFVCAICAK